MALWDFTLRFGETKGSIRVGFVECQLVAIRI